MLKRSFHTALLTLSSALLVCGAGDSSPDRVPVLLELFTSEGCSSCPPADRLLEMFDGRQPVAGADLVVLSEHVDYWDHLGWKDPFSSPLYTARQQEYTNRYKLDGVYTPQLVVDGRYAFVGSDEREASAAIQKAIRERKIPIAISNVERNANQVTARIDLRADQTLQSVRAILYVALADNREESHVARGENAGRSLSHVAVTRVLKEVATISLGNSSMIDVTLPVPPASGRSGLRLVAFIQDPASGHVLGMAERTSIP
jgi:hypothetical protein